MSLRLSDSDKAALAGELGPGTSMAMSILVRMASIYGARELMDITAAHVDSSIYMGIATMEYAERLVDLGARVSVPSTLNVTGVDEHGWEEWAVPKQHAENAKRQMVAYEAMGCIPTWTCAPYQTEHRPVFGQQIAAGESNAICFYNSVIGARTERYPDLLDICAAIAGRVPATGLHLEENRAGTALLQLVDIPIALQNDDSFYPVLGYLVGGLEPDGVPVISGVDVEVSEDRHKAICAGASSAGAVALYHLVGSTPEAETIEQAFHGRAVQKKLEIRMPQLLDAYRRLTTATSEALDMVVLGSPHFSINEFRTLSPLLEGRVRDSNVEFLVTCSRSVRMIADELGLLETLKSFGGRITVDTCPLATPMLPERIKCLMTNSAKYAYYSPGLLNTDVTYGSLTDCVRSAVEGRVIRDESLWIQ